MQMVVRNDFNDCKKRKQIRKIEISYIVEWCLDPPWMVGRSSRFLIVSWCFLNYSPSLLPLLIAFLFFSFQFNFCSWGIRRCVTLKCGAKCFEDSFAMLSNARSKVKRQMCMKYRRVDLSRIQSEWTLSNQRKNSSNRRERIKHHRFAGLHNQWKRVLFRW